MEIEEFVPVKKDLTKKIYLLRFIIILLMIITLIIAYLIIKNKKGYKLNLVGENEVSIHINEEYNDPGCEVLDNDGYITEIKPKIKNDLDNKKVGTYKMTCTYKKLSKTRYIHVLPNE